MKTSNCYFPVKGKDSAKLIEEMINRREQDFGWEQGKMFGFVYYPGKEIADTLESVYKIYMHDNRLNPTAFNSLRNMEKYTYGYRCQGLKMILRGLEKYWKKTANTSILTTAKIPRLVQIITRQV